MNVYFRNRNCPCVRCRTQGMMGAAVLVTVGVLWLLHNYYIIPVERSFPVLFLVIGAVLLISRTGSTEGHVDPAWYAGPTPPPAVTPQPWSSGVPAPPRPTESTDPQVKP
jgi:hypothetical protein